MAERLIHFALLLGLWIGLVTMTRYLALDVWGQVSWWAILLTMALPLVIATIVALTLDFLRYPDPALRPSRRKGEKEESWLRDV